MVPWPLIAAICCAALLMLPAWDGVSCRWRLHDAADGRAVEPPAAAGLDAALAMLTAGVRAGGTLVDSLSRLSGLSGQQSNQSGQLSGQPGQTCQTCQSSAQSDQTSQSGRFSGLSGHAVDRFAVIRALAVHARDGESAYLERIAAEVCAAAQLSSRLGCELGSCLEAVSASFRRSVGRDQLVAQASAMPKATVKLLLVLPFGTWAFGALLGAHPLQTLLGSPAGVACLCLGLSGYAAGAVWVRSMVRSALQES